MNRKKSASLVVQTFVLILVLVALPISVAGYYLYTQISADLTEIEKERILHANQAAQSLIHKFGDNLLGVAKTNSYWEDYRAAVEGRDINWIDENVSVGIEVIPDVDFIVTSNTSGQVLSSAGDLEEFNKNLDAELVEQLKEKGDYSGLLQTSKGLSVIAVSKITDEAGSAPSPGLLVFGRLLDHEALEEIKETLKADLALLTNSGTVLSTREEIDGNHLSVYLPEAEKDQDIQHFTVTESGSTHRAQMVTALKDFTDKPLGILYVDLALHASTMVKSDLKEMNLILGIVLLFALALMTWLVYRRIIIPIHQLVLVSSDVAKGMLSTEVNISLVNRKDELGKLGSSIQVMISNFLTLIEEVYQAAEQVAASAEKLSANAEQTTKATHQIASVVQEVASGADTQLQGAMESSIAMEEMAKGIQHIAETAAVVSADSADTEKEAERGNLSIKETIRQMESIDGSVHESAAVINQLSDRLKEINQIASLITSIASQTNLLALNAVIEAARAGEQGRGFAVVAAEVRKLAEQTAASAKQVSDLIAGVQNDSYLSVESMSHVNQEVQQGMKQVQEAGEMFGRILQAAKNVAQQTQEVSAVSEEMLASTQQISASVEGMASIARESSGTVQHVVTSSHEQLSSMEEITYSAEELRSMSQKLKELLAKFK